MRDENKEKAQLISERAEQRYPNTELNYILATLVENLSDGIIVTDFNGQITFVNKSTEQYSGYSRHELIGRSPGILNGEKDADIIQQEILASMQRSERWCREMVQRRKDGSTYLAELEVFPVLDIEGKQLAWASIHRDITERKRAEETLRLSEKRFYKTFNASPNPMAISTLDGRYIEINSSFTRIVGYNPEEVLGLTPDDLNIFTNPDIQVDALRIIHEQGSLHNFEAYIRNKSGDLRFGLFSADILDLDGDNCILTLFNDITERKQAEEELRNREQFLNSIFESIQDILSVIDTEFSIIRTNKKTEQLFSHELPLVGKKCYKVYHGMDDICIGCPSLKAITNCEPTQTIITLRDSSGNNKGCLDYYCYPFIDTETSKLAGVIVCARDITEKLRVEHELARMERFHLIGQMAAGIGHEIRNPMTAVRGFLQLLGDKREYAQHKEYFDLMLSELDRANSIITEYLSLAKNKSLNLTEHNLSTILAALQPLIMAEAMDAGIDLSIETGDVPTLLLNENEIRQLILNLVKNGLEATEYGGKLTMQTYTENNKVVLSVKDQGPGIRPDLLEKLGTPFLTTKEKGTGLGLAVCYGIAARHNAAITIDTGPEGTTFFVRFNRQM